MSLRRFMHRTRKDEDLAEEIESHLAHAQDANIGARFVCRGSAASGPFAVR